MKTRVRNKKNTPIKKETETKLENLQHHHKFGKHTQELDDFKKYLWQEIYASKYLYTMGKHTAIIMALIILLLFLNFNIFPNNNFFEALSWIIVLGATALYFLSFFVSRIYYKKQVHSKRNQYFFESLHGSHYDYIRVKNSKGWYNYLISKY